MGCSDCAKRILAGVAGLLKAATGTDAAPAEVIQSRRDVCRECPRATRNTDPKYAGTKGLTTLSKCEACGCFLRPKTSIRTEACPEGKWAAA